MNEERWLVSYADFITLLFAFFVVMFASSQVDKNKMAVMASTFDSYVNGGLQATRGSRQRGGNQDPQASGTAKHAEDAAQTTAAALIGLTMSELKPAEDRLAAELLPQITAGQIEISLQPRGLILSLKESAFFAPGDDAVSPRGLPIVAKVAEALARVPGQIRLEGHTDNTPIRTVRFPSNWQLSTARSIAVLKLLTNEYHLPSGRFAVAGYGQHQPLEQNDHEEGRARNRRVDVVILTRDAAVMAPPSRASK